jgi:hypothetical protein
VHLTSSIQEIRAVGYEGALMANGFLEIVLKSELAEYFSTEFYNYLVGQVFAGVNIPVQFLAAEAEVVWDTEKEGRPIFDGLVSRFKAAPKVESAILLGGGHNYEFSHNVGILWDKRKEFVEELVRLSVLLKVDRHID